MTQSRSTHCTCSRTSNIWILNIIIRVSNCHNILQQHNCSLVTYCMQPCWPLVKQKGRKNNNNNEDNNARGTQGIKKRGWYSIFNCTVTVLMPCFHYVVVMPHSFMTLARLGPTWPGSQGGNKKTWPGSRLQVMEMKKGQAESSWVKPGLHRNPALVINVLLIVIFMYWWLSLKITKTVWSSCTVFL